MKPLLLIRTIFSITLKDLSKLSGISIGMLCEVENGRIPSPVTRQRIIDALKVGVVSRLTEDKIFRGQNDGKK
jgi:transcriptional regulator with XRE-family HTH domain